MYPEHRVLVSDADREAVLARLSAAAGEGRLTLDEFSDRTQHVYASRTCGDLASLVDDLPAPPVADTKPTMVAPPAAGSDSKLPLLALIFGIVSLLPLADLAGVAGIVLGILALRTAARDMPSKRRMALAGLICSSLGLSLHAVIIAIVLNLH